MSKNKSDMNHFLLNKIIEIKFEDPIISSKSISVNENTFAFVCYHYKVQWTETIIDFIKFYAYINNNFNLVGKYNFDNTIIEKPSDFVQMKVENENLIIITNNYLIIDKIMIFDGKYSFKNIICQKLDEIPYKILDDLKIVFCKGVILKIYQFSLEGNDKKCLFELSYNIFTYDLFKNKCYKKNNNKNKSNKNSEEEIENNNENKSNDDIEEEENFNENNSNYYNEEEELKDEESDDDEEDYIFGDVEIKNKINDILEIKEKNLIIISFSKFKHTGWDDIDYTLSKYVITIIDSRNYQIITNLFNLIEAEKLFYFGNNELFSFGYRKFFKLNLKCLKSYLILSENYNTFSSHYYHYNIVPFLNKNKMVCLGYYRCGYYHNRTEYKHCCLFDMKNNILIKDIDITNIHYNQYNVVYYPLKLNNNKILFIYTYGLGLFELNTEEESQTTNKYKYKIHKNSDD